jgi:hypothetical protein
VSVGLSWLSGMQIASFLRRITLSITKENREYIVKLIAIKRTPGDYLVANIISTFA